MKPGRIVALVIGVVLILPGIGAMFGGSALGLAYAFGRDDAGFFEASIDRLETPTVAITAEDIDLTADPGDPDEFFDVVDADVRLRVTGASSEQEVFVGVGPEAEVDLYLSGVAHDEIRRLDEDGPVFRSRDGGDDIDAPTDQSFWVVSASGRGTQELVWEAESGRWAAVLMNADGSPAVAADVDVGVKAGIVLPLAIGLMVFGFLLTVGSVALIVFGARGAAAEPMTATVVPPARAPRPTPRPGTPVTLEARIDPELSSWQWLVKWFLAIPHYVVLFFLWIGFAVTTVIAFFAILFTGRYPASLFDYAVGVLRWSWRVSYYATSGIGTDRYPPFSLGSEPDYPATLEIDPPETLSRGLVLVKWWLLAIPHYLVVGLLVGGTAASASGTEEAVGIGLLPLLTFFVGVVLLVRKHYPRGMFDLIIGGNRWVYRVIAYTTLMTDEYPPFRLDQGGTEPAAVNAATQTSSSEASAPSEPGAPAI
jgi:hypothetical protein